jgi:hypothetical protein
MNFFQVKPPGFVHQAIDQSKIMLASVRYNPEKNIYEAVNVHNANDISAEIMTSATSSKKPVSLAVQYHNIPVKSMTKCI